MGESVWRLETNGRRSADVGLYRRSIQAKTSGNGLISERGRLLLTVFLADRLLELIRVTGHLAGSLGP